jgi:hypothetical protein
MKKLPAPACRIALLAASALLSAFVPTSGAAAADAPAAAPATPAVAAGGRADGILPVSADGKPLNLDFEAGTFDGWSADGEAFAGRPVKGDTVAPRRKGQPSNHQGQFWVGGFENGVGDNVTGTLTSSPFKVTHRWASFLLAGGAWPETRVELLTAADNKVFFKANGTESETLRPVLVDLEKQLGQEIKIRLVDQKKGHWGHLNFDDFRFHRPSRSWPTRSSPPRRRPRWTR